MESKFKINYEELYNTAPCGYICSQPDGKIIEVNNRFLEFTGYKRAEVIERKNIVDFLTKAGNIQYDSSFVVILKLQGAVREFSFFFVRKDQTRIPVLVNSVEIKNKIGESLFIQTTVFDISQRKNFENQLIIARNKSAKLTEELLELNKELESFAHIAAHDLKAPILDIEGHFEYIQDKLPSDNQETTESVKYIHESIKQFKNTIEGLTAALRIKSIQATSERLDLFKIIADLSPKFRAKVLALKGTYEADLGERLIVQGSEVFVRSVLQNIVGNSIKYHSDQRPLKIQVICKAERDFICITVKDNGEGIDLELYRDKVFGKFNRFNSTLEGSGMGLHITKKMVEQMNGKIYLESKLNEGTSILIKLRKGDET